MNNKEKNFMSAIIYVHNAQNQIEQFLTMVMRVLEEHFEHSEIICVNDFSMDDSASVIKEVSKNASSTTISLINLSYYHGLETAMNAGMDLAIGDFVLEFDAVKADFEQQEIMNVYRKALEGYDIVSASPDVKPRLSSKLFYMVFNQAANLRAAIGTERFRVLSRRVINRISDMNKTMPYRKAAYANCGLRTANITYQVTETEKAKVDRRERQYRRGLAIDTLILFTNVGYQFSVGMTAIMMFVAVFMALYTIIIYLLSNPVAGWTTTVLFMAFAFFGLFGILTIIIKYLQILVSLIFRRKKYSFESIEKLTK